MPSNEREKEEKENNLEQEEQHRVKSNKRTFFYFRFRSWIGLRVHFSSSRTFLLLLISQWFNPVPLPSPKGCISQFESLLTWGLIRCLQSVQNHSLFPFCVSWEKEKFQTRFTLSLLHGKNETGTKKIKEWLCSRKKGKKKVKYNKSTNANDDDRGSSWNGCLLERIAAYFFSLNRIIPESIQLNFPFSLLCSTWIEQERSKGFDFSSDDSQGNKWKERWSQQV